MRCFLGFHDWQPDGYTCEMERRRCSRCSKLVYDFRWCYIDMFNSTAPPERRVSHDCPTSF